MYALGMIIAAQLPLVIFGAIIGQCFRWLNQRFSKKNADTEKRTTKEALVRTAIYLVVAIGASQIIAPAGQNGSLLPAMILNAVIFIAAFSPTGLSSKKPTSSS